MSITMDVDGDDYKPVDEFSETNGYEEPQEAEQPTPDSRESVAPTALSPPPPPDSSAQTPAPVPQPKSQTPYRPNYKPKLMLSGHSRSISSVKFSPDGSMLASCGECFTACSRVSGGLGHGQSSLPSLEVSCG